MISFKFEMEMTDTAGWETFMLIHTQYQNVFNRHQKQYFTLRYFHIYNRCFISLSSFLSLYLVLKCNIF